MEIRLCVSMNSNPKKLGIDFFVYAEIPQIKYKIRHTKGLKIYPFHTQNFWQIL